MLTGCSRAEVEETIQPLVADAIEESDSEAEAVKEEDESPLIPEIDTDIKIHAGSRDAVSVTMCPIDRRSKDIQSLNCFNRHGRCGKGN